MGISMVADLYYEVQVNLLTEAAGWEDFYNALTQAAINLGWDGTEKANLESACQAVAITPGTICQGAPANDDRADAVVYTLGASEAGNTHNATGPETVTCTFNLNDYRSVWYSFTPPTDDTYRISLCGDDDFDTTLALDSGWISIDKQGTNTCNFIWWDGDLGDGSAYQETMGAPVIGTSDLALCLAETSVGGSGLRVLILFAGTAADELADGLLAFSDIGTVDSYDAGVATPSAALMRSYDVVVVTAGSNFNSPSGLGDALADYIDLGSHVIPSVAAIFDAIAISGRYVSDGYSPFNFGSTEIFAHTLGTFDGSSPIMTGITSLSSGFPIAVSVASGATLVASWDNGTPIVAVQDDHSVGINIFATDGSDAMGDVTLLFKNAVAFLALGSGGEGEGEGEDEGEGEGEGTATVGCPPSETKFVEGVQRQIGDLLLLGTSMLTLGFLRSGRICFL